MAAQGPVLELGLDQAEDEEQDYVFLGKARTVIVGIRYYDGKVGINEMVQLTREPENPYDANAIRVDNIRNHKVGHIKREVALQLASLIDSGELVLEGVMPGGYTSKYDMPLDLYFFGRDTTLLPTLYQRLPRCGLHLQIMTLEQATQAAAARTGQYTAPAPAPAAAAGSYYGGGGGTLAGARASPAMTVVVAQDVLDRSLDQLFDNLYADRPPPPSMQPAPAITTSLLPHQQQALAWMVSRENSAALPPFWEGQPTPGRAAGAGQVLYVHSLTNHQSLQRPAPVRGGILADDMGLGKTLSIVSLIATNRPGATVTDPAPAAAAGAAAGQQPPAKKRKKASPAPSEPAFTPPAADGPRPTLVVAPLSVLSNWQMQFEQHTDGSLEVYTYHGTDRNHSPAFLSKQDVVLTSYQTLASEFSSGNARSGLRGVHWLRVVLDEAHNIKNPNTQQSKAVHSLNADRRWAVTGTPVQNRLRDLLSVMMFLRLDPLQERTFWQRCLERPMKAREERGLKRLQVLMGAIALRRTKQTQVGGRPLVTLPSKQVLQVTVELSKEDAENYALLEQQSQVVVTAQKEAGTIMQNLTNVLTLLMRLRQVADSSYLAAGALKDVREMLAAARATSGPPDPALLDKLLTVLKANSSAGTAGAGGGAGGEGAEECPVCLSPLEAPCITVCAHVFCRPCIEAVMARDKPACPLCRHGLTSSQLYDPPPASQGTSSSSTQEEQAAAVEGAAAKGPSGPLLRAALCSSKVGALMKSLAAQQQEYMAEAGAAAAAGEAAPPPAKAVVFSQFVGMLDLVGAALTDANIPYVRMDGRSSAKAREAALRAFADPAAGAPLVFLTSLKCGGVGMNLVSANQVHLMEPWWNPSVEEQAMDRVHRLGQTRDVKVFRYIASNTMEQEMVKLQAEKAQLAKVAFAVDTAASLQLGAGAAGGGSSSSAAGRAAGGGGRGGRGGVALGVGDILRLLRL